MSDQQDDSNVSGVEEKMFEYHQDRIDVTALYLAPKLADVHFAFDSDDGAITRIPSHKNLLVVTSDVFDKMFCGELSENGDIKIVDASEAAFKEFLQFFYLNDVKLSAENVSSVLYLGNKYNVEKCIDACVKFLAEDLTNENVCAALLLAIFHEQKVLTHACEKRILLNAADIFKSAEFSDCSKEVLAHILKMNLLSCSEVEVFEACMEWVRAKSQQQILSKAMIEEHLGDLYYQIRFASMTPKEFYTLKTKYEAVLSSDFEAIICLIERLDIDSEHFLTSPRQFVWNKDDDAVIECSRDDNLSELNYHNLDIEEKTIFSVREPLVLGEFRCGAIFFGKSNVNVLRSDLLVKVKVIEGRTLDDANGKILCSMKANIGSNLTKVSLPHPILLRPDLFYTILIEGFPEGHCFKSFDQKSSVTLKSDIKIEFYNDKVVDGKIVGQIYELRFNKI